MKKIACAVAIALGAGAPCSALAMLVVNYSGANVTRTYNGPVTYFDDSTDPAFLSLPADGPSALSNNDQVFVGSFEEKRWAWLAGTGADGGWEGRYGFCSASRDGQDVVLNCR